MLRKFLLVSIIAVVFGLGWLGSWIYSDGKVQAQVEPDPVYDITLEWHEAALLALTKARTSVGVFNVCFRQSFWTTSSNETEEEHKASQTARTADFMSKLSAEYTGAGKWFAIVGVCAFIVDDTTGKVTGP